MKRVSIITILCCWLAGCSKDKIDAFGETAYLYLANKPNDISKMNPIEYSFAFHPGANKDTVPIVVKLMGKLSEEDRPIDLSVDAAQTTAAASDYELPGTIVLRAGRVVDTIVLVLHNSARLKTSKFKIRLVLNDNEYFLAGPVDNRFVDVTFSDMIARPAWWNATVETNFLARYSDTKYRLFIEATGIADMTGLQETEQRAYAIIFRDFLARGRENGEVYEDENGMINVSPNLY